MTDYLGSLDSSRDLQTSYVIIFVINLYLVLQIQKDVFSKFLHRATKRDLPFRFQLSLSPELFLFSRKASVRILARSGSLSLPGMGRRQERQGKREKEPKPKSPSPSPPRAQEHNSTSLALDYSKTKSCACHTLQNLILRNYECLAHILFPIPMILF